MLGVIHDKLNNDWFNNTSENEDDLEGILDYLKPRSYDGSIDLDDEAYNKRRCRLLGMTYEEPTPILIKKVKVTRYTVGPGETYTKVKVLGVEKIPRTRDNVAAMRARLIKKWPKKEITKQRRFLYKEIGIQGLLDSYSCGSKVLSWRNHRGENEVVLWTLCKKSTLVIITWRKERHLGESFANSTLISLFHFLNCTIGTLYKLSERMGVELPLDL
ncbi:hypothetical protein Tco_1497203 [Tanacetum coccineum]